MNCGSAFSAASHLAPVVLRLPVAGEFLHRRQGHALRLIRDRLLLGPLGGRDALAQGRQRVIRDVDVEGADLGRRLNGRGHGDPPRSRRGLVPAQ